MARKGKQSEIYHCDGYYYHKVCPSRGEEDPADIRIDSQGWVRRSRCICKTLGLSPFSTPKYEMCPHCVEFKKYFRHAPAHDRATLIERTPFKAISSDYKVQRAWKTQRSLVKFLADHPTCHGVNVNTGQIIYAKTVV